MALIRWEPAREIESLQQEVNRLFGSFFDVRSGDQAPARRWVPAMDLVEEGEHFVLKADLPGVEPGDVNVELDDDVLTVSGKRASSSDINRDGVRRIERATGTFSRSLTLPAGVDPESIEASFERGVLEVRIPRPAEHRPRRVEINVGSGRAGVIEGAASTPQRGSAQPEAGQEQEAQKSVAQQS